LEKFAELKICITFALAIEKVVWELAHGVMVTLRFLVPSFKVRVLVGQQKKTPQFEEFFIGINLKKSDSFESDFFCLYFESNDWSFRVVY
jgi:hypothetical protein